MIFFIHCESNGISSRGQRVYHHRRCISSAEGCIFRNDDMQHFVLMICNFFKIDDMQGFALILFSLCCIIVTKEHFMKDNLLLNYAEQLATNIELLCKNINGQSNTIFQIRKSSSSIYANVSEANYGQSKLDMVSKFEIALKECSETESWLRLLFNTDVIDEKTYKTYRNLCGRIRRMLISSCKTFKEKL